MRVDFFASEWREAGKVVPGLDVLAGDAGRAVLGLEVRDRRKHLPQERLELLALKRPDPVGAPPLALIEQGPALPVRTALEPIVARHEHRFEHPWIDAHRTLTGTGGAAAGDATTATGSTPRRSASMARHMSQAETKSN